METITLNIQQKRLDSILSSDEKLDIREIRPKTDGKYLNLDSEGYAVQDENGDFMPKKYDAIQYNIDGKLADYLVKIEDIVCQILDDENGETITYEYEGEVHTSCQIVYLLGDIIEKSK